MRPTVITTRSQLDEAIEIFRQDQQISSFLEVAVGQTTETARRFLQRTDWNTDEAVNLFLASNFDSSMLNDNHVDDTTTSGTSDDPRMFRPPTYLLSERLFQDAKAVSIDNNLWLIVNLQSRMEFACQTLNRDVWLNDGVSEIVRSNFILWQVYDHTIEGQKISSFYKIESDRPVVLLIDPITGQKMHMWSGVIEAQSFVDDLMKFTNASPHEHVASLTRYRRTETSETCSSRNNTYQPPASSWGEEFEEEDTYSSSDDTSEEFENEDTYSSSINTNQVIAPSGNEEFEKEDTYPSSINTSQVVAPSWGEEFEKEDTYSSSNNIVAPSWGEEFEKEDIYSSRNNTNQVISPSWDEEIEKVETLSSSNNSDYSVPPTMFVEEVEEDETSIEFPVLTEEPKGDCDSSIVCSLCIRFPDGRRKQRKFLKSEPIQLLWSFCYSHMESSEKKAFKLVQAIPGASKTLDYEAEATFDQAELTNSIISVTWE